MPTCEKPPGHPLWDHVQFQEGVKDAFQVSEHAGEAQAEEHDEEQHGPDLGARHLYHRLGEHNERQAGTRRTL